MNQAITTDCHDDVKLTGNELSIDDLIGVVSMLCFNQRVLDMRFLEHRLNEGPVKSGSTCAAERIEKDQNFALLRVFIISIILVFKCPKEPSFPFLSHLNRGSEQTSCTKDSSADLVAGAATALRLLNLLLESVKVQNRTSLFG